MFLRLEVLYTVSHRMTCPKWAIFRANDSPKDSDAPYLPIIGGIRLFRTSFLPWDAIPPCRDPTGEGSLWIPWELPRSNAMTRGERGPPLDRRS